MLALLFIICLGSGIYILTGGQDKQIHLFNSQTGSLISTYTGHSWPIHDLAISTTTTTFLSGGGDRSLFLWDISSHRTIRKFPGHSHRINAVCYGANDSIGASASYDRSLRLWDLKSSSRFPLQILDDSQDSVTAVQINGHVILVGSVDGHVRIYDLRMGKLIVDNIQEPIISVCFTEDRLAYLASSLDSTIRLLDTDTGALLNEFKGHRNSQYQIRSTLFNNDAQVASGSEGGELFLWDLVTAEIRAKLVFHQKSITSVSSNRTSLLTCSLDGTSAIWTNVV